jgi:hypothetical protein
VLTRPERLVSVAAAGVLLLALVTTSYAGSAPTSLTPLADTLGPTAELSAPAVPAGPMAATATPSAAATRATAPPPAPLVVAVPGALPARAAAPTPPRSGCPAPVHHPPSWTPKPLGPPLVAEARLPKPLPRRAKARDLAALTGKGIWVTDWPRDRVDVRAIVARAAAGHLTSIWVRTGGSRQGYYGGHVLPALVPAAHRAGINVIAWDFPFLSDPVADAARARLAFVAGVDAFSPDVETAAEGTHLTSRRVTLYLSLVRSYAGGRPVVATVPRPTTTRLRTFPYAAFPAYADAFAPMVYWSCNEPGALVAQSLQRLGRWLPVAPVGQAYDMGPDGGRAGLPSRAETWRFLDSARRGGAIGGSLWTIERIGSGQESALRAYPWPGR